MPEKIEGGYKLPRHHQHYDPKAGNTRILWAVMINVMLTLVQIIGGVLSGSLALIADAIHNLSDALSLVLALFARKIAQRPSDGTMTFGYGRAEVVAALINYISLILLGLYLTYEAVLRIFEPTGVDGWLVVAIATFALVVDTVTAFLTYALSKESMNIRAAFLHNVADMLGSVAVIIAGTVIILYDWRLIDPLITLLIAGYILWQSMTEIGGTVRILMLGSPPDQNIEMILGAIRTVQGVADVHHLHLWQMQEHEQALDAHIVIKDGHWNEADSVKLAVKTMLHNQFGLSHITLELECHNHACKDPQQVGHIDTFN